MNDLGQVGNPYQIRIGAKLDAFNVRADAVEGKVEILAVFSRNVSELQPSETLSCTDPQGATVLATQHDGIPFALQIPTAVGALCGNEPDLPVWAASGQGHDIEVFGRRGGNRPVEHGIVDLPIDVKGGVNLAQGFADKALLKDGLRKGGTEPIFDKLHHFLVRDTRFEEVALGFR